MEKSLRRLRPLPCLLSYTAAVRSFGGSRSRNKGRGSQTANKCLMNTEGSYHFGKYQYSIFRHYILDVLRDTKYFDGWRTIDTLRYLVFWWLAYCWYFVILSIFMVGVLLILWDTKYFNVGVLLILWYTKYFGGWRTVYTLRYLVFRDSILAIRALHTSLSPSISSCGLEGYVFMCVLHVFDPLVQQTKSSIGGHRRCEECAEVPFISRQYWRSIVHYM